MRIGWFAILLVTASQPATAEPACLSPEAAQRRLDAISSENQARQTAALAQKGVKRVLLEHRSYERLSTPGTLVSPLPAQPLEVVYSDERSCDGHASTDMFEFAIDRQNHVSHVIPNPVIDMTIVPICGCGLVAAPVPQSRCSLAPVPLYTAFSLPPQGQYSGDLAIGYSLEIAVVKYSETCTPPPRPSAQTVLPF